MYPFFHGFPKPDNEFYATSLLPDIINFIMGYGTIIGTNVGAYLYV